MFERQPSPPQLPSMYDLPSENPEEPGLPDTFHDYQPELLRRTFRPPNYPPALVFSASDLNLYYDAGHVAWYKRPDWFGVVGVENVPPETEARLSYVYWVEQVAPMVVVELLSPGTEAEDLGKTQRNNRHRPPTKWEVYEQILQIPYYFVFDRRSDRLRAFYNENRRYRELNPSEGKVWLDKLQLGLGLYSGEYEGWNRIWLRWYGADGHWIPTPEERERAIAQQERTRAQQERTRAESAEARAEALARRLRELGFEE